MELAKHKGVQLDNKVIKDASIGAKKKRSIWDKEVPGFVAVIQPTGRHTFALDYQPKEGPRRRMKIGNLAAMTVEQARKEARKLLNRIAAGEDPMAKAAAPAPTQELTLDDLRQWMDENHPENTEGGIANSKSYWAHILKNERGALKLRAVTEKHVGDIKKELGDKHVTFNRTRALLSKAMNFAEQEPKDEEDPAKKWRKQRSNPCYYVPKHKEFTRDRALTETVEFDALKAALHEMDELSLTARLQAELIRLLHLLPVRKGDLLHLRKTASTDPRERHNYLDTARKRLVLYNSKGGSRFVELPELALAVFARVAERYWTDKNPWVFPSQRKAGAHFACNGDQWKEIRSKHGLADYTRHDARRTFGTEGSEGLDMPDKAVQKTFDHGSVKTTLKYILQQNKKRGQNIATISASIGAKIGL